MLLSRHNVGTYPETSSHATCPRTFSHSHLSLLSHCGKTGVEWTPNASQHTKLTPEKKILPPLLLGFELRTFRSQVLRSSNELSSESRIKDREHCVRGHHLSQDPFSDN